MCLTKKICGLTKLRSDVNSSVYGFESNVKALTIWSIQTRKMEFAQLL